MITTIIFDLSEVLLHGLLGIEEYIYNTHGLKVENSQWKIQELEKFFHGEITEEEYWEAVIKKYNWDISVDSLKKAVRSNFREIEGTREVILRLKKNGYKLGLLSVHSKEWIEYCEEQYGYHSLFDTVMYSFEVAVSKPNIQAFQLIVDKLHVRPEECLFIDDWPDNIESAKQLGMQGLQFVSPKQLTSDLKELGVDVK